MYVNFQLESRRRSLLKLPYY